MDGLATAWGNWLDTAEWDFFVTSTFHEPRSKESAARAQRAFIRQLERRARKPLAWFWAMERSVRGWPHLHTLIGGSSGLTEREVRACWRSGRKLVETYQKGRGGAYYVTKHMGGDIVDYDISSCFMGGAS